jgi:hypothetical protein
LGAQKSVVVKRYGDTLLTLISGMGAHFNGG